MRHRGSVLLVEDNDDHREALEVLVSSTGLDGVGVRTGAEALSQLREEPGRWCVVLLDWWLPDMTGEIFCSELRADPRIARTTVAAMTGDGRARGAAERFGIEHFFVKPFEPDIVTELLSSHCRGVQMEDDDCGCGGRVPARRAVQPAASGRTSGSLPPRAAGTFRVAGYERPGVPRPRERHTRRHLEGRRGLLVGGRTASGEPAGARTGPPGAGAGASRTHPPPKRGRLRTAQGEGCPRVLFAGGALSPISPSTYWPCR